MAMSEVQAMTDLTDEMLADAISIAGTMPPGGSWSEVLGVEPETLHGWRQRGIEELRRVAGAPKRRVRRSEERYVVLARLTGVADAELLVRTGDNVLARPSRRPLSLTPQMIDIFVDALWEYDTITAAAHAIGKTRRTVYNWLNAGRALAERIDAAYDDPDAVAPELSSEDELRLTFFHTVSRVEAEKVGEAIRALRAGFIGERDVDGNLLLDQFGRPVRAPDWRAASKYLERRFPREWRAMDPAGDEDSAAVKAAKENSARKPIGIVVLHPAAALEDAPLRDEDDVIEGESVEATPPEPQYLEDLEDPDDDDLEVFGS